MRFFTRSAQPVRKNHMVTPSTNLSGVEPRLAFNRTVVLQYRFSLEQKNLAPSTIQCAIGRRQAPRLRSL
jgi:hypothetical protein